MDAPAPFTMKLPLDRVTALSMEPGAVVGVSGRVTASIDGSSFDAANLFDFAAGGLHVVDTDPAHFAYVLAPTGQSMPACAAAGGLPCLVPRLDVLAHQRLHTATELASTLSGSIELESHPKPSAAPAIVSMLTILALGLGAALALAWAAVRLSRRAAKTALGRVRLAARAALRVTHGDATLLGVRTLIRALVARARQLDALRRACARKLARIDRGALERRADACARSTVPVAGAALESFAAESAAAAQLESDHGAAVLELERIESTLRTVTLRVAGAGRPFARRLRLGDGAAGADPVSGLLTELDLREQAIEEVRRLERSESAD
jgi:hypothetical protein